MRCDIRPLLAAALLAATTAYVHAQDVKIYRAEERGDTPRAILIVPPDYPAELRGKTPNGYIDLSFGLATNGTVRDPRLLGGDLPGPFLEAVLDVIKFWRFEYAWCKPPEEGQRQYQLRVFFEMDSDKPRIFIEQPPNPAKEIAASALSVIRPAESVGPGTLNAVSVMKRVMPIYPASAARQGITRGSVVARLHIREAGDVDRLDIVSSEPRGVFEAATKIALCQWRFAVNRLDHDTRPILGEIEVQYKLVDDAPPWTPQQSLPDKPGAPMPIPLHP